MQHLRIIAAEEDLASSRDGKKTRTSVVEIMNF